MAEAYTVIRSLEEFSAAREQFNALVSRLRSEEMSRMEHGEVEATIAHEGNELLRRLLQGHLDLRAKAEERRVEVVGADGVVRRHCREGERRLMSLFGEVEVKRLGYGARGERGLCPLDAELNVPPDSYSHGLRRRVAEEAAKLSFDETVLSVARTTGGHVPKRQAEELAATVAQDFEAFYQTRENTVPEDTADPLIMSLDGKGIVMRPEGLREATRKAAEREQHKMKTRLSAGEKRNRKRMATVAAVYSIEPHPRTAETLMGLEEENTPKPRARNKRVWASVRREAQAVTEEVFEEALRRDPHPQRPWVMLVDGQPQQLRDIHACIARHAVEVTLILDFIHVLEYLWSAAFCFYAKGSEGAEAWVLERALHLLQGKASDVAAGMRRSATLRGLSRPAREGVDACADYLLKYRHMLHYDEYLARGLPIATGVIEGACRHLINDRMDITGARWGLDGAEAILKLRSLRSSGDFDSYWEFHKTQELARNHTSRYECLPLQKAA
ncbi:MAG: ISKra4 family transposase [Chloroflexi bacterium]|nr:ISKra4 family transposase [Chloroflexota bacterium]